MLDLSRKIETLARQFLAEANPDTYRVAVVDTGEDMPMLKGATDSRRRTIDPNRAATGLTHGLVSSFKARLKAEAGVNLSLEAVDALLLEAQYRDDRPAIDPKRAARLRKAKQREEARRQGRCTTCCWRAVAYDANGEPKTTCLDCTSRIIAAQTKRRATAKAIA